MYFILFFQQVGWRHNVWGTLDSLDVPAGYVLLHRTSWEGKQGRLGRRRTSDYSTPFCGRACGGIPRRAKNRAPPTDENGVPSRPASGQWAKNPLGEGTSISTGPMQTGLAPSWWVSGSLVPYEERSTILRWCHWLCVSGKQWCHRRHILYTESNSLSSFWLGDWKKSYKWGRIRFFSSMDRRVARIGVGEAGFFLESRAHSRICLVVPSMKSRTKGIIYHS